MLQTPENTTVILLAAGHGNRMRPLTEHTPKPLLKVRNISLIEHHLIKLADLGFKNIVINTAYLGFKIQEQLGSGKKFGLRIEYSDESDTGALETAGGIKKALPLISSDVFLSINADIWTDFDFTLMLTPLSKTGRIALVPNPSHNPDGDFLLEGSNKSLTFSGIAVYRKNLFEELPKGKQALGPILKKMVIENELDTMLLNAKWTDVGTPERLEKLNTENT
jgi:MurNAc alpha-1-phosphate uridylyltransferase